MYLPLLAESTTRPMKARRGDDAATAGTTTPDIIRSRDILLA
jgi:hypothetical protein